MAEAVGVVGAPRPVFVDRDAGGDAVDVRMRLVNTAVDDGDVYAAAGPLVQVHGLARA